MPPADVPSMKVGMGGGFTHPTVKFGNVKYYVYMEVPCAVGEQDDVIEFIDGWVDERLQKKMNEIVEAYGS